MKIRKRNGSLALAATVSVCAGLLPNGASGNSMAGAIATLDSAVTVNSVDLAANKKNIAVNAAELSALSGGVATNVGDIQTNAEKRAALSGEVAMASDNMTANTQGIALNESAISGVQQEARGGIASLAALSATATPPLKPGESGAGIGLGYFQGESAIALAYTKRSADEDRPTYLQFGLGTDRDNVVVRAGVSWTFRGNE